MTTTTTSTTFTQIDHEVGDIDAEIVRLQLRRKQLITEAKALAPFKLGTVVELISDPSQRFAVVIVFDPEVDEETGRLRSDYKLHPLGKHGKLLKGLSERRRAIYCYGTRISGGGFYDEYVQAVEGAEPVEVPAQE